MEKRKIPTTDVDVSVICIGTMNWGTFNTEPETHEQLDYAVSQGCNFIDTAEIYPIPPSKETQGQTETYVGEWMKKRGNRNTLVVASKVSSRNQAGSMRTRDASIGLTKQSIAEAIDGTLMRLQTDNVDLYQVHVPDRKANYFGVRGYEAPMDDGGASIEETQDGLIIQGIGNTKAKRLHGAACTSYGDHRVAMSMAIAGLTAEGETKIQDTDCIETSFPGFESKLLELLTKNG